MSAIEVAASLYEWARRNGALADARGATGEPMSLFEIWPADPIDVQRTEKTLAAAQITGIIVDEVNDIVHVATKNALGPRRVKPFPKSLHGTAINYIGHVVVEPNPPSVPPSSQLPRNPWYLHNGKIACGSSVTSAPIHGAGTMGCLVRLPDGTLCGLTNNHVTGDCNHTVRGMYILAPAPVDADPQGPAPLAIGRHHSFVQLASGDPLQTIPQELDVALFAIEEEGSVTSMQGNGFYDTPNAIVPPSGMMKVKKVGRTTGITTGTVLGQYQTPFAIPYRSPRFNGLVYFDHPFAVQSDDDRPFSAPGDSGSLVVMADESASVGILFAGAGNVSVMMPLERVIAAFGARLESGLGV
jgi:hypothetical protein